MQYIIHTISDFNKYKISSFHCSIEDKTQIESQIPIKYNLREEHGADAMILALIYLSNICAMPLFFLVCRMKPQTSNDKRSRGGPFWWQF